MDQYLDGRFQPFIESARGCPYACTFCEAASSWYNKVNSFTVERVKKELLYIAKRMKNFPDVPLAIADSNFGMLKRDEEISDYIGIYKTNITGLIILVFQLENPNTRE